MSAPAPASVIKPVTNDNDLISPAPIEPVAAPVAMPEVAPAAAPAPTLAPIPAPAPAPPASSDLDAKKLELIEMIKKSSSLD